MHSSYSVSAGCSTPDNGRGVMKGLSPVQGFVQLHWLPLPTRHSWLLSPVSPAPSEMKVGLRLREPWTQADVAHHGHSLSSASSLHSNQPQPLKPHTPRKGRKGYTQPASLLLLHVVTSLYDMRGCAAIAKEHFTEESSH